MRRPARTPHGGPSGLERELGLVIRSLGYPEPAVEYRFDPVRRWRFDFAWPAWRLACEAEGGTWIGGRHVRGSGYEEDCEKYNAAALAGWTVLRFTEAMVADGRAREWLERARPVT